MNLQFSLTGTPDAEAMTDYDLDPALVGDLMVNQTFSVNVVDDVPESGEVGQVGQAESVSLDEDDLVDGTDGDKESLSASGDLGMDGDLITIDYGADGPADGAPAALQYDDLTFELSGPAGLTSQGEPVTYSWDANTNTLQATADGRDVFLHLHAAGQPRSWCCRWRERPEPRVQPHRYPGRGCGDRLLSRPDGAFRPVGLADLLGQRGGRCSGSRGSGPGRPVRLGLSGRGRSFRRHRWHEGEPVGVGRSRPRRGPDHHRLRRGRPGGRGAGGARLR